MHLYPTLWVVLGMGLYHAGLMLSREFKRSSGGGLIKEFHSLKKF